MTYAEAISAGYRRADARLHRGYISRRIDQDAQPVHTAGGSRRGELYVELPNWRSTTYMIRQYLVRA